MCETPPREFRELLAVVRGYQRSRAVTVAAERGIADMLRDGPRSAEELATATGTHAPELYRLLRALASIGIFVEGADRRFELSPMGQYLRRDHPLSADPAARMFGAGYEWRAWGELEHSVRTGENAAVHALGSERGPAGQVPRPDDARFSGRTGAHRGRVAGAVRGGRPGARRGHPRRPDQTRDRGDACSLAQSQPRRLNTM
jgi:hypothetical protein